MADIFTKRDAEKLLRKKNLWFWGDSNMRGMYKDLIWLLERNTLIDLNSLKGKLEGSFMNDVLVKGGALHRGRNFQEIRCYKNFRLKINIEFTFLTQCFSRVLEDKIRKLNRIKDVPDVIVMNSCLWDITSVVSNFCPALYIQQCSTCYFSLQNCGISRRHYCLKSERNAGNTKVELKVFNVWGPESVAKYKSNLLNLIKLLKSSLPSKTRVIWITTPPISNEPHGGFFIKQIEFLKHTLRFDVMEANSFVSREFTFHGFDVLDIHYHLLLQIHRRRPDGIHWNPEAVRHITNLFLTHVCLSWDMPLPGNFKTPLLTKLKPEEPACSPPNPTETQVSVKAVAEIKDALKSLLPQNGGKRKKSKRGKKRDRNGNLKGHDPPKIDFTKDIFDYDYKKKRFKVNGRRNC